MAITKCPSVSFSAFSFPYEETLAAVRRLPNNLPLPTYQIAVTRVDLLPTAGLLVDHKGSRWGLGQAWGLR
jgi:hypothetical protein